MLLGSPSAGQEIIYPVGGRCVSAFSRWVGGFTITRKLIRILNFYFYLLYLLLTVQTETKNIILYLET